MDKLTGLERDMADKLAKNVARLPAKELAAGMRNVSTAKGINTQHVHLMRGRPTEVHDHRYTVPQLDAVMTRLLEEAETVTDAEVVEAKELPA